MSGLSKWCRSLLALGAACMVAGSAAAAFPERPIQLTVPFAAGSPPDILARLLADAWKRSGFADVVVVN